MENPIKMDDVGVHLFLVETPIPRDPLTLWACVSGITCWETMLAKTLSAWTWDLEKTQTRAGEILRLLDNILVT